MKKLWSFSDKSGGFCSSCADKVKSLYFPLGNESIMSSITPDLHGDIKTGQNAFLLTPVSRIDLTDLRSSRNFWVDFGSRGLWSATGVSRDRPRVKRDKFGFEAGLLWQEVTRLNKQLGISARILSFVPAGKDPVEIMHVTLTNISSKELSFTPTAAIPIYGRGANNIRDHRHVTSLLQRVETHRFGVIVKPALAFDESGHKPNTTNYFVLGWDENCAPPVKLYPDREAFCGDGGDLEEPEALFGAGQERPGYAQGREAMGGLGFGRISLRPKKSRTYTIIMGITEDRGKIPGLIARFNNQAKLAGELEKNKSFWTSLSRGISVETGDTDFDNWFRWVNIQPTLRKIFGCSFLPDFDYGKGGRGWRDLWQDCLGLILNDPAKVRASLINNFCGVKIDGSNATIIGRNPGEFIADRNNISRVWMDHGAWPLLTLELYINETGDFGILFEKAPYFYNHEIKRTKGIDPSWAPSCGSKLKVPSGRAYEGTIFEHLLVQNLVQFFNVGGHNHIRLEGADWNDGLDMAGEKGESVAFSAMYAQNLETLARLLSDSGMDEIEVAEEVSLLFAPVDYGSIPAKRRLLEKFFSRACVSFKGKKVRVDSGKLSAGLKKKSLWMKEHIKSAEWLKEGFFNGYYDNLGRRLEGKKGGRLRMTLTGQVFAVMAGIADAGQTRRIIRNVNKYLVDRRGGGIRLNTDFKDGQLDLGRAFSFSYGDKENGAVFSHMAVMYGYALCKQGYAREAWEALNPLYRMACDSKVSKIYPCLPEYFDLSGRGMYAYLTGSASWFILTMLTRVFGVRGNNGDLIIEPGLSREFFRQGARVSVERVFSGRRIKVNFWNKQGLDYGKYRITGVALDSVPLPVEQPGFLVVPRKKLLSMPKDRIHLIDVFLG
ncbi:MAG: cellobiose phosphorylase [Candidatus Omnitrophota bacterium]